LSSTTRAEKASYRLLTVKLKYRRTGCWGIRYKPNKNWSGWKIGRTEVDKARMKWICVEVGGEGGEG